MEAQSLSVVWSLEAPSVIVWKRVGLGSGVKIAASHCPVMAGEIPAFTLYPCKPSPLLCARAGSTSASSSSSSSRASAAPQGIPRSPEARAAASLLQAGPGAAAELQVCGAVVVVVGEAA